MRSGAAGPAGEHVPKIMLALVTSSIVVVLTLVMTRAGRDIDAATQHFMLYYAGVFALIGLTASVGAGLMAADRIFMTPGHRVMAQAVHRAVSFAALAFLVIHIVTEILAQRVHVIDAFIPFLSPYRTFYIGLGTIASDLILLVIATSILRKRFTAHGKAWRWRAVHYASYAAFVLGVLHGLLGGREAKPYVDWSYGFAIAATALALAVRFLSVSLRTKGHPSAPAGAHHASGGAGLSPLHAAALRLAQARLGGTAEVLPGALGSPGAAIGVPGTQSWALPPPARDGFAISGPHPALDAPPAHAAHQGPAFTPLGAPAYTNGIAPGIGTHPYAWVDPPGPARTEPGTPAGPVRQPRYEPGYDGPPRFEGAPRTLVPQDDVSSYPYGPRSRPADRATGPMPRSVTGPMPRAGTGPDPLAGTGPLPRASAGPLPRAGSGPMTRPATGPAVHGGTGPMPRPGAGPVPRADTGPLPRADSGPRLRTGRTPRPDAPPVPPAGLVPRTARRPRGAGPADPVNRDVPGPAGGDEW